MGCCKLKTFYMVLFGFGVQNEKISFFFPYLYSTLFKFVSMEHTEAYFSFV